MDLLTQGDVPYGNDWDSAAEAVAYGEAADRARPWRAEMRGYIADRVATLAAGARILELGSGPGLLAHRVLERCPHLGSYTLLDFSEPMLALSRERLAPWSAARFVLGSFKADNWPLSVDGPVDCVVSMQAVHELRHKRHARRLYEQVHRVLAIPGLFLVCDHAPLDDSERSSTLYMTESEHLRALADAGFANAHVELVLNGLPLYAGEKAA